MQLRRRHFLNMVITKNPAHQKIFIHFFIDNSNANISLYTLSCLKSWVRLRGPVIQANGRLTFEGDLR